MALNKPQEMSKLLSTVQSGLAKSAFFSTLPANILTIPLEMLADYKFSCPCDSENNTLLTGLVFSAPAFYILALILLYFYNVLSTDKKEGKEEKRHNKKCKYCIDIILYLFPPILWIIMLLLDGDYIACSQTYWKGEYVLDDKLKIKWCKPTGLIPGRNENELQILTLSFINKSQRDGYGVLLVYSIVMVIVVLCGICKHCQEPNNPSNEEEMEEIGSA